MNTKSKRMFGIGSLIVGAVLIVFSFVIKAQVTEGEGKISRAEKGQGLFNMSPYTKSVGDRMGSRISAGKEDIAFYTTVANVLMGVGVVLVVVGGGSLLFGGKSAR